MIINRVKRGKPVVQFILVVLGAALWMFFCTALVNHLMGIPVGVHQILINTALSAGIWLIGYSIAYTLTHLPMVRTKSLLRKFQRAVRRVQSENLAYMFGFAEAARAGEAFFTDQIRISSIRKRSSLLDDFCRYWTNYEFHGTSSSAVMARIDGEALCLSLILSWDADIKPCVQQGAQ